MVTLLDGTVMDARCRGMDGERLHLSTRDGRPDDGLTVALRWDHAGEAYEAAGVVDSPDESSAAWAVKLTQEPLSARYRRYPRVLVRLPVRLRTARTAGDVEAVAVDLSGGGMRVSVTQPAPLERGDEVEITLVVEGAVLRCPARVAHTSEDRGDSAAVEYGLVFCDLGPDAVAVVSSLVEAGLAPPGH